MSAGADTAHLSPELRQRMTAAYRRILPEARKAAWQNGSLLHHWRPDKDAAEPFHDHPRWSITVCLQGRIVERTPWTERTLRPGSVVLRSRKAIHSFRVPDGYSGKTWTLFIVGRGDHRQNTYSVVQR